MTNDERKLLEDSAYAYGTALLERGVKGEDAAWAKLMADITRIQRRSEDDLRN